MSISRIIPGLITAGLMTAVNRNGTIFINRKQFLTAASAVFGIDASSDTARFREAENALAKLVLPWNLGCLKALPALLPGYKAWTASGAHRFMPLAVATANILTRRPLFSQELMAFMPQEVQDYMVMEHPVYANPKSVIPQYIPSFLPDISISVTEKDNYKWLDIGSAPKDAGAPTLNLLRSVFPEGISFTGSDIAMPAYSIRGSKIVRSPYVDEAGEFLSQTSVKNILYLNAALPKNNVMSPNFLPDETFDFISVCMTLHHLRAREGLRTMPFTSHNMTDEEGLPFSDDAINVQTSPSQQSAVDRLLDHLDTGGIMFLNPTFHMLHPDRRVMREESNDDLFFAIKRLGPDLFQMYDRSPIVFRPNRDIYSPSGDICGFLDGSGSHGNAYDHNGITGYLNLTTGQKQQLQNLFYRADLLAVRHQSWKNGVWGRVNEVLDLIRAHAPIDEIVAAYLRNVPDEGNVDSPLKAELMRDTHGSR